jgi:hypothetical protein
MGNWTSLQSLPLLCKFKIVTLSHYCEITCGCSMVKQNTGRGRRALKLNECQCALRSPMAEVRVAELEHVS